MKKYKAIGMNTGFGTKKYSIMFYDGEGWLSSLPVKYYKTLKGANRVINKKLKI